MLQWTAAGAVTSPTTVQVRLSPHFPDRVAAGAPSPTRGLSDDELERVLRAFTVERRGPRVRPCDTVVLSGVTLADHPRLAAVLDASRSWGIGRVVLHLGRDERNRFLGSPVRDQVDDVTLNVRDEADLSDLGALGRTGTHRRLRVQAVILLDDDGVRRLDRTVAGLVAARPDRVVFTWPLPNGGADRPPPRAERVVHVLGAALERLTGAGLDPVVKGLPACSLGVWRDRVHKTANRWYVDGDHPPDRALLFFPDVVRFVHPEVCRFCALADRCDGPPEAWWRAGYVGRLDPVAEAAP